MVKRNFFFALTWLFYIKYFVLPYSIDVVSTPSYLFLSKHPAHQELRVACSQWGRMTHICVSTHICVREPVRDGLKLWRIVCETTPLPEPIGNRPYSEPMLTYLQLDLEQHISMTFCLKSENIIKENAFENAVCKMTAILSRPRCVKGAIWFPSNTGTIGMQFMSEYTTLWHAICNVNQTL